MTRIRTALFAGALLFATPIAFTEEAHHPAGAAPETPNAAAPAPAQQLNAPGSTMPGGMMSGGMMPGMMSGDMMQMMMGMMSGGERPMMGQAGPMGQMMSPEYVEGRIAFLKAELKVTEAQQPLWDALAGAIRANAGTVQDAMPGMRGGGMMMGAGAAASTPIQRVETQEKALASRLDALRQIKAALEPFYAALDEAQKEKADKLLVLAPMGMM